MIYDPNNDSTEAKERILNLDANLQRKIKMKRLSFPSQIEKQILENTKMFDQFYIFGAPPDSSYPLEVTLLAAFPSTSQSLIQAESFLNQLKIFSFPSGIHQLQKSDRVLLQEFVFYLKTGTLQTTYGICVHFAAPASNSPFFATYYSRNYPFCICFLSKVPFLTSHFQFASFITLYLCGIQKPTINLKERRRKPLQVRGFCPRPLVLDRNYPSFAVFKGFSIPKFFFDLIYFFYSLPSPLVPVPSPLAEVDSTNDSSEKTYDFQQNKYFSASFSPIALSGDMTMFIPYHFTLTQCLTYPTFHYLFSHLSPASIVKIYTAIILEKCVLFVSSDLQLASFCVIAATSLISPFVTQATVLPIIPDDDHFQTILQSPIPYVVGSTKANDGADVIVDLDEMTVLAPKLPELPGESELVEKLEMILKENEKSILVPPKFNKSFFGGQTINPQYEKFIASSNIFAFPTAFSFYTPLKYILTPAVIECILALFAAFFPPVLSDRLESCYVTDNTDPDAPITVVNKSLLVKIVPEDQKSFYKALASTQIFIDFSEKKIDSFMKKKLDISELNQEQDSQTFHLNSFRYPNSASSLI